jgi:hypothetical protein
MLTYETKRILIWGKTYPELSTKHLETVCTGGVTEDGKPIRLYPIPYRYLDGDDQFKKYQWITARAARNHSDPRPESHRIDCESIVVGDAIKPDGDEWSMRAEVMFRDPSWQFSTMDDLQDAQRKTKASIGVVNPREILEVEPFARPNEDGLSFNEKLDRLRRFVAADREQMRIFEEFALPELKGQEFVPNRIRVRWLCHSPECKGHNMQVLDWEAIQLQRKVGNEKALEKVRSVCDVQKNAVRFFLGNTAQHPAAFCIVGFWYPKRVPDLLFR